MGKIQETGIGWCLEWCRGEKRGGCKWQQNLDGVYQHYRWFGRLQMFEGELFNPQKHRTFGKEIEFFCGILK